MRARGVGHRHPGGRTGLEPLDLEVSGGEVLAVIGPNGSGKTTLVRLLATDLRPTSGRLELFGGEAEEPRPALRRRIAYAADRSIHLEPLTGVENLRFFGELAGGDPVRREAEAERLLAEFGLGEEARVPVGVYSFGMRRKLLLIEALQSRPGLLLLDEPTVGLDPDGIRALGSEVRRSAEEGAAVVLATNEVRETPRWASRILFLHGGRVVADQASGKLLDRLGGRTRIEVAWAAPGGLPEGWGPPAAEGLEVEGPQGDGSTAQGEGSDEGLLVAVSTKGGLPLPILLDALLAAGAEIRSVRVREPDLGDLFRELTGEPLAAPGREEGELTR